MAGMLQNPNIKSLVDKLWNRFWSGGISNPLTAIEQITYLLFMKKIDDLDLKRIEDAEFTGEKYKSKFEGKFKVPGTEKEYVDKQTLRWSYFKQMPAEEMLNHVQSKVFPFLKELNGSFDNKSDKKGEIKISSFTKHMKNAVFIIPKPSLLVEAISIIEEIYEEIEEDSKKGNAFQDIQGDVYEMLLNEIASAGKNGQFRTPRHIIRLIAELLEPQLGQRIADPACGTAGFLLAAYQYIVTQLDKNKKNLEADPDGFIRSSVSGLLTEDVKKILEDSLHGFDIDGTMVRLGLMNLIMHGIENPHIDYKDTLSKSYKEESIYDLVMANPPFTGNIDKGDINEDLKAGTTKTELLFLERIFNMLKMGGTAGVIIPQGVLFGSNRAFTYIRKKLIEEAELKAVITMPSGVFKPYAGVSTAILIFTRGGETEKVWFYQMESDGYTLDDKRSKLDNYGDLQEIVSKFKARNSEKQIDKTQKYFFVDKEDIVKEEYDLSFNRYKEEVYEEIEYEDPAVIINKLIEIEVGKGTDKKVMNQIDSGIVGRLVKLQEIL